jgi:hypothetical protein
MKKSTLITALLTVSNLAVAAPLQMGEAEMAGIVAGKIFVKTTYETTYNNNFQFDKTIRTTYDCSGNGFNNCTVLSTTTSTVKTRL